MRLSLFVAILCCAGAIRAANIETIAGVGKPGFSGDGGMAKQAEINNPYGLTIGPGSALYFCDMGNHRIRKIGPNGAITTVAGNGAKGWSGDGGPALQASLNEPYEMRFDKKGNLFFVEMRNHLIRRVDAKSGLISTVAGQGRPGFAGDGGPATTALFNQPHSIQFVKDDLWVCDIGNQRLRKMDLRSGTISTVGGTGEKSATHNNEILAGNPLNGPRAIDVSENTLWLALREGSAIYKIDLTTQRIQRAAGSGAQGFTGNDGPALEATLSGPKGIAISPSGLVLWADTESHTIRSFDRPKNTVHLLAGTGQRGDGPDGDPLHCQLNRPHGIYVHTDNTLYIGDSENHRIRRLRLP